MPSKRPLLYYTYFIQAKNGGPIKIGKSLDPKKRLQELQTGHSESLVILGFTDCFTEDELHDRFRGQRLNGEWFKLSAELYSFLVDLGIQPNINGRIINESFKFVHVNDMFESHEYYDLHELDSLLIRLRKGMKCRWVDKFTCDDAIDVGGKVLCKCTGGCWCRPEHDDHYQICNFCYVTEVVHGIMDLPIKGVFFSESRAHLCIICDENRYKKLATAFINIFWDFDAILTKCSGYILMGVATYSNLGIEYVGHDFIYKTTKQEG